MIGGKHVRKARSDLRGLCNKHFTLVQNTMPYNFHHAFGNKRTSYIATEKT